MTIKDRQSTRRVTQESAQWIAACADRVKQQSKPDSNDRPLTDVPKSERWLDNNPKAKASVERGLQQSAAGNVRYLGSFAQFADLEIDD